MYIKDTLKASISGNANTATTLQTARNINGTAFNGSASITTANWGTARTLTIGNKGQSVNGSANVTWSLADIGAAAASHGTHVSYGGNGSATTVSRSDHTHNYAGSSSAGGAATMVNMDRTPSTYSANYEPGANRLVVREYDSACSNIPSNHWYHVYTGQGSDAAYQTQLAVGMTTTALYFRNRNSSTWGSWKQVSTTDHTHDYAAKSHGHNEIWIKDAPFNSSNDTTANWGGQGVSVSWYPDGTTITDKPNSWGFIFNMGRGTEVHQMWFSQATGTTYHRGGNGSGWSGSWRAILDSANYSSYAAPASHSHSYLPLSGGTLSGPVIVSGESRFHNGSYSDPWNGTSCAIKATGNIAATGIIKANGRMDIQGQPLSIQSSAPTCGGIWIQI